MRVVCRHNVVSDCILHSDAEILPQLQGMSLTIRFVSCNQEFSSFTLLKSVLRLISPNLNCSVDVPFHIVNLKAPNFPDRKKLAIMSALRLLKSLLPVVEHPLLQLLLVEPLSHYCALLTCRQRFQRVLEPSLEPNLHLVVSALLQYLCEPSQRLVAMLVKLAIVKELIQ